MDQFLTYKKANLAPVFNFTAYIYIYNYIYMRSCVNLGAPRNAHFLTISWVNWRPPKTKQTAWFRRTEYVESISSVNKRPPQELTRGPPKPSFQRPEFRGPLLDARGGRKLALESPKFSLVWALMKSAETNNYFYSVISFRWKFATKMASKKRVENISVEQGLLKKRPHKLTLGRFAAKKPGKT